MARTTHTARKVTGERADKIVRLSDAMQGVENLVNHDGNRRSPRLLRSQPTAINPPAADIDVEEDDNRRDKWCSGCTNGGILVECDFCEYRSACGECITFVDDATLHECKFICPVCHIRINGSLPYFAFLRDDLTAATTCHTTISCLESHGWFSRADSSAFAVISIRLSGISDAGHPPQVVSNYIRMYFEGPHQAKGGFRYFEHLFNLENGASILEATQQAVELLTMLKGGSFERILVFVTTHSDPDRGDLHVCKGSAATPDDLFSCLFPEVLREYLKEQDSVFVLLACGATMTRKPSFDGVLKFATSGVFRATIGFSAPNFLPCRAAFFLAKFTDLYFFRCYTINTAFKSSLGEESGLGAHGNVILVTRNLKTGKWSEKQYIWTHMGSRPWGNDLAQQCGNCGRLRVFKLPIQSGNKIPLTIEIECLFCKVSLTFKKPDNMIIEGNMGQVGQGQWCYIHRAVSHAV